MINKKLKDLLEKNPSEAARFILKNDEKDNLIRQLWNIFESNDNKKLKKSYKKALYILRSNGINVDALKLSKTIDRQNSKSRDIRLLGKPYRSFLYIPDSLGNSRILISIYNETQANYEFFDIIYNMEYGIKQLQGQKISKKVIDVIEENEKELMEVPVTFALGRLKDVSKGTNTFEKIPDKISAHMGNLDFELHPVLSIYPPTISNIISVKDEKDLFSRPEIARLMIPDESIKNYKKEIIQAQNSILVVNNKTPQERINGTVERFIQNYFTMQRLAIYRNLLLDIALYFYKIEEKILTKRLINYAEKLIIPMVDINTHPLVQLLVYKSFFIN